MNKLQTISLAAVASLGLSGVANAAIITQLNNFGDMTSIDYSNDFESTKNSTNITFEASNSLSTSAIWTDNVTSSGTGVLTESKSSQPMIATLGVDAFEVGLVFGNDDFNLSFDAILSVYDALNNLLGTVTVLSNANDYADQFIGLSSDTAFRSVHISYEVPDSQNLSIVIDDFSISTAAVPEPATAMLLGLGLVGLGLRRHSATKV